MLLMTGFEPRTTGVGSDRSINCVTTTALSVDFPYQSIYFQPDKDNRLNLPNYLVLPGL